MKISDYTVLSNGVKMPLLGLGTFRIEDSLQIEEIVKEALNIGYIHIDTATVYNNEEGIGKAIKDSGIKREKIFITSKVANDDQGYETTLKAFNTSLEKLQLDYLDLYLIHWPRSLNKETWKALEFLYKQGKVRAIGVSNFLIHHLEDLLKYAEIKPMVNQIEHHPYLIQQELLDYCIKNKIQVEAWAPIMKGKVFEIPLIKELSKKYNKTEAQIVLRWNLQRNIVVIPKSAHKNR